jgi:hypothetical protein
MTVMTERIQCGPDLATSRDQFFTALYERVFPSVAGFIRKQHGSLEDAKDVFHDSLIIYYEKKLKGELKITLTPEAYIFGIAKHLWIKRSKNSKHILLTETESFIEVADDFVETPRTSSIIAFLKQSGEKCMELLQAFYYDKKPLDQIKSVFGFSTVRSATVQKFKCLEKVREVVKNKSKQYEDFFE